MNYRLYFEEPQLHFIRIELDLPASRRDATTLKLSKWRPGRYELAPYSENIADVRAVTASGKSLEVSKTAYNCWHVEASEEAAVVHYKYYAVVGNAGGSLLTEDLVYFNGINFFLYEPGKIDAPSRVELDLPADYKIACGLKKEGHTLFADDFHQLTDAPLMASASLQHYAVEVGGLQHNIWFQGEVKPDWNRIAHDFIRFGEAQVAMMGGFPVDEYHYLFLIHNKHIYHGVEHYNSTIIALGPGFKLMRPELYEELLGVSCHELFHTWNVKAIRPADMQPYDYDQENYSRLHYITEGVTTYYGDLLLLKSGVWDLENYLRVFNTSILRRHYNNNGRDHITLEQSSFDSWLVGYKSGVPNRKISFYTKGALAAFILDHLIREGSANERSLDTVMREMYDRFGKTGKGYTREDYKSIAESHSGRNLDAYFDEVISGTVALEPRLELAARYFGLQFIRSLANSRHEHFFGLRVSVSNGIATVEHIHEGSPAMESGLAVSDRIIAVNRMRIGKKANFAAMMEYFESEPEIELHFFRNEILDSATLKSGNYSTASYMLAPADSPTESQLRNLQSLIQIPGYQIPGT